MDFTLIINYNSNILSSAGLKDNQDSTNTATLKNGLEIRSML